MSLFYGRITVFLLEYRVPTYSYHNKILVIFCPHIVHVLSLFNH